MNTGKYNFINPYEICSIRPPTENNSLTFRLARNCYWNKCRFCPVYKTGAKFSKRSLEDVLLDIEYAKQINSLITEQVLNENPYPESREKLDSLIAAVKQDMFTSGRIYSIKERNNDLCDDQSLDERTKWFLSWFKDKPTVEDSFTHIYSWRLNGGTTCFLGDSDGLIFNPDFIRPVTDAVLQNFPTIKRITIYGRTRTAARVRLSEDLRAYASAGINRVHFGIESGSDTVLNLINKGETSDDHLNGVIKIKEAGISCSVYIMPGLGGQDFSLRHAEETASLITKAAPDFIRLRTLEIFPGTPLDDDRRNGKFIEATEEQVIREIRTMVMNIETDTEIVSDSATNLLEINGRLPGDRDIMLGIIDKYLLLNPREKIEFSFFSRLQSFIGQYGGLSSDIYGSIQPFLSDDGIDISEADAEQIYEITKMIKGKLMP